MEEGFVFLNYILPSHRILLILLASLTCYTYYWLFSKYIPTKLYWLGFFLLTLFGDKMLIFQFSGLRNAIAINIMTLSVPFIINRKIAPYFALTILAYLFHYTVLIFMPLAYFFATPKKINKLQFVLFGSIFLFFTFISPGKLINLLSPIIESNFARYISYTELAEELIYDRSYLMYGFVFLATLMIFFLLFKGKLASAETVMLKLTLLFLISLVLGVLNFRMSHYFAPYLLLSCFVYLKNSEFYLFKYCFPIIVICYLWYSFYFVFLGTAETDGLEYRTFL
jgi:hypothetical protein